MWLSYKEWPPYDLLTGILRAVPETRYIKEADGTYTAYRVLVDTTTGEVFYELVTTPIAEGATPSPSGMTREVLVPGSYEQRVDHAPSSQARIYTALEPRTLLGHGVRVGDHMIIPMHVVATIHAQGDAFCVAQGDQPAVQVTLDEFTVPRYSPVERGLDVAFLRPTRPGFWAATKLKSAKYSFTTGPGVIYREGHSGVYQHYGLLYKEVLEHGWRHTISTYPGMSGGGIYKPSGGLMGVHIGGVEGKGNVYVPASVLYRLGDVSRPLVRSPGSVVRESDSTVGDRDSVEVEDRREALAEKQASIMEGNERTAAEVAGRLLAKGQRVVRASLTDRSLGLGFARGEDWADEGDDYDLDMYLGAIEEGYEDAIKADRKPPGIGNAVWQAVKRGKERHAERQMVREGATPPLLELHRLFVEERQARQREQATLATLLLSMRESAAPSEPPAPAQPSVLRREVAEQPLPSQDPPVAGGPPSPESRPAPEGGKTQLPAQDPKVVATSGVSPVGSPRLSSLAGTAGPNPEIAELRIALASLQASLARMQPLVLASELSTSSPQSASAGANPSLTTASVSSAPSTVGLSAGKSKSKKKKSKSASSASKTSSSSSETMPGPTSGPAPLAGA